MKAYLSNQQPLTLGKILGQGGEGRVFALEEVEQQHAVKIYHQLPSPDKQAKLKAMVADNVAMLGKIALWPKDLVYNEHQKIIGFVMPRLPVGSVAIHHLYNPSQRKQDFPKADYAFLVHAARNLAAAFAYLHSCGHCVGDVNQGNVVVAPDATITLIDCDSFQINHQGQTFACEVGVAHFTPPELHGQPFAEITKTPIHDNFGLAILIFHLLMMGRHPFAGVYLGEGEMPIEKAITEFRYAYSKNAQAKQMQAPPKAPSTAWLSDDIQELFESAFDADINKRPTAEQWLIALEEFGQQLVTCDDIKQHKYYKELITCSWCNFAYKYKMDFFAKTLSISLYNKKQYEYFYSSALKIKKKLEEIADVKINKELPEYLQKDNSSLLFQKIVGSIVLFSIIYFFLVSTIFSSVEGVIIILLIGVGIFALNLEKYLPKIAIEKISIPRSFWIIYVLITNFFNFIDGLIYAALIWIVIKKIFVFLKFNKNINKPLDLWLHNLKYFQVKNDYWLTLGKINSLREEWQNHILAGKQLAFKRNDAISSVEEYISLLNMGLDTATARLNYLSSILPTLPERISKEIEYHQENNQNLLDNWSLLHQEKAKLESKFSHNNKTLLPLAPNKKWRYTITNWSSLFFLPCIIFLLMNNFNDKHQEDVLKNELLQVFSVEPYNTNPILSNANGSQSQQDFWDDPSYYGIDLNVISVYKGEDFRFTEMGPGSFMSEELSNTTQSQGNIRVIVRNNPKVGSVVLLLHSEKPVTWSIVTEKGVIIDKVFLSSYSNSSRIEGLNNVTVVSKNLKLPYKYNQLKSIVDNLKKEFNVNRVTIQSEYRGVIFMVN